MQKATSDTDKRTKVIYSFACEVHRWWRSLKAFQAKRFYWNINKHSGNPGLH